MIINNNSVEQINVALLDIEKRLSGITLDSSALKTLEAAVDNIKRSLNETKSGLTSGETDYQKVSEKDAKAGYVHCDQTANGTYILVATVNNGAVTYSWQART